MKDRMHSVAFVLMADVYGLQRIVGNPAAAEQQMARCSRIMHFSQQKVIIMARSARPKQIVIFDLLHCIFQ